MTSSVATTAMAPRKSRLRYEYEQLRQLKNDSRFFDFEVIGMTIPGEPPERYRAIYNCQGIIGIDAQRRPVAGNRHRVEIYLHAAFPRVQPKFEWETPIWHPNINHPTGELCIDPLFWSPARNLYELCTLIGEMIMYKRFHYTATPPFPLAASQREAAWCAWAIRQQFIPPPNQVGFDAREFLSREEQPLDHDLDVRLLLPDGAMKNALIPAETPVGIILADFIQLLQLQPTGHYIVFSETLGRRLSADETPQSAGVPPQDCLRLVALPEDADGILV